jgi:hypothetical protein
MASSIATRQDASARHRRRATRILGPRHERCPLVFARVRADAGPQSAVRPSRPKRSAPWSSTCRLGFCAAARPAQDGSASASQSAYVADVWRQARSLSRLRFIRPCYWELRCLNRRRNCGDCTSFNIHDPKFMASDLPNGAAFNADFAAWIAGHQNATRAVVLQAGAEIAGGYGTPFYGR